MTVGVFIGATDGIGKHTAQAFVKATDSPKVYIVGRNQRKGDGVVENCLSINPNCSVEFVQADMSLMKDAERVANLIKSKETTINTLQYSAGGEVFGDKQTTSEGLDFIFAVHVYSRVKIYEILAPLVDKASPPGRIVSVLSGGRMKKLDEEMMDGRTNYSLYYLAMYSTVMVTLTTLKLAREYPQIAVIHVHPGAIAGTNLSSKVPFYIRIPFRMFSFFMESAESCGERMVKLGYSDPKYSSGGLIVTGMEIVNQRLEDKGWLEIEDQELAYAHVWNIINSV